MKKLNLDKDLLKAVVEVLLENVAEGIHITDSKGCTLYYNDVAARIDGIRREEAIGKSVLEMFPSLNNETSTILQALKGGKPVSKQVQNIRNMYGFSVFLESTTIPLKNNGLIIGAVDISRDVTKVKELTEKVVDLQSEINSYRHKRSSEVGREEARYVFDDIIGNDPKILEVKKKALRASRTNSPVLITGPTGTGKELLVHAIHNASPRSSGPFISQNCAALPATLMEGILFGAIKGSFTGAENRPGLVELADGGTLLLDEITCLDVDLQSKLLRFIQDGFIRRIGDTHIRKVNVRVIASTNIEPQEAVEKNLLRPDLYYRLNVVNLSLPPLRERSSDVLLLSNHFLQELNRHMGMRVTGLSKEVAEVFVNYEWPGNVRELNAVIEGAMNIVDGQYVEVEHLPAYLLKKIRNDRSLDLEMVENLPMKEALERVELALISKALEKTGGNISQTAKILGIPRQTLQYKIQHFHLRKDGKLI